MVDDYRDDYYYYWSYETVEPASEDDSKCMPLLNGTHLSDGRIPVVLGMGTGILTVPNSSVCTRCSDLIDLLLNSYSRSSLPE